MRSGMLAIILTFGSIDALIPLVIIIILIAAAAGLTRGFNVLKFFGIETLAGIGAASAAKGSLIRKTAYGRGAGEALVGKGGKMTSQLFSPAAMGKAKLANRAARSAAFKNEIKNLSMAGVAAPASVAFKAPEAEASRAKKLGRGAVHTVKFALKAAFPSAGVAYLGAKGAYGGAKKIAQRNANKNVNVGKNVDTSNIESPFSKEMSQLRAKTSKGVEDLKKQLSEKRKSIGALQDRLDDKRNPLDAKERSALIDQRRGLLKEVNGLKVQISQHAVSSKRLSLLEKHSQDLQASRTKFVAGGDVKTFQKEFNKIWDATHTGGISNRYAAYSLAAATPGIVASARNPEKIASKMQALEERLQAKHITSSLEETEKPPKAERKGGVKHRATEAAGLATTGVFTAPMRAAEYAARKAEAKAGVKKKLKEAMERSEAKRHAKDEAKGK